MERKDGWLDPEQSQPDDEQFVWGYDGKAIELCVCRKWNGACFYRVGDYYRNLGKAERRPLKLWRPLEWPDLPERLCPPSKGVVPRYTGGTS